MLFEMCTGYTGHFLLVLVLAPLHSASGIWTWSITMWKVKHFTTLDELYAHLPWEIRKCDFLHMPDWGAETKVKVHQSSGRCLNRSVSGPMWLMQGATGRAGR